MKTAYEIAMDRLDSKEPARKLTDKQKKILADIDCTHRAKIAERETFLGAKIAGAKGVGAGEEAGILQDELARDVRGIREEWERKKEQARTAK